MHKNKDLIRRVEVIEAAYTTKLPPDAEVGSSFGVAPVAEPFPEPPRAA
jgi:hypothetical protein